MFSFPVLLAHKKSYDIWDFFLNTIPGTESLSQLPFKSKYLAITHVTNQKANRTAKKQNT